MLFHVTAYVFARQFSTEETLLLSPLNVQNERTLRYRATLCIELHSSFLQINAKRETATEM